MPDLSGFMMTEQKQSGGTTDDLSLSSCTLTYALDSRVMGPPPAVPKPADKRKNRNDDGGFRMWDWRANGSESKMPGVLWGHNEQFCLLRVGLGDGADKVVVAPDARSAAALQKRNVPHQQNGDPSTVSIDTTELESYVGDAVCDDLQALVKLVVSSQTKPGGKVNPLLAQGGWTDLPDYLPVPTASSESVGFDMPLQTQKRYPLVSTPSQIKASISYKVGTNTRVFRFKKLLRAQFDHLSKQPKEKFVVVTSVTGDEFEFRIIVKDRKNQVSAGVGFGTLLPVDLSPLPFPLVRTKIPMAQQYALAEDFGDVDFSAEPEADEPPSTFLAWKMGAGKTWGALNQVLAGAAAPPRFLFIVAPSNLVGSWLSVLNQTVHQQAGTATIVYLMGKEHAEDKFFARDPRQMESVMRRSVVVMDEVQYYKHADRTWEQLSASPFYENIHNARHRVFLTGTPLQNDMDDTKGLMALLACGTDRPWPWEVDGMQGWDDEVQKKQTESDTESEAGSETPDEDQQDADWAQIWRTLPSKGTQKSALAYWTSLMGDMYVSSYDPMHHTKTRVRYPSKLIVSDTVPTVPWVSYEVQRQGSQKERILSIVPVNDDAMGKDSLRGRLHTLQMDTLPDFVPCPKLDALCDHVWNATAKRLKDDSKMDDLSPKDVVEMVGEEDDATYLWPKTVYTSYTKKCLPHIRKHMWKYIERVHDGAVRFPTKLQDFKDRAGSELLVCELQENSAGELGLVMGTGDKRVVDPKAWKTVGDRMHRIHDCTHGGGVLIWGELSGLNQGTRLHGAYCEGKVNLMFITDAAQAGTDLNYQDMPAGTNLNLNSVSLTFVEPPYNQSKLDQTAGRVFRFSMYDHMFRTVTESHSIIAAPESPDTSEIHVLHLMCNAGWLFDNLELPTSKDSSDVQSAVATLAAFAKWAKGKLEVVRKQGLQGSDVLVAQRIGEYLERQLPDFLDSESEKLPDRAKSGKAPPADRVDFDEAFKELCAGKKKTKPTSDQRILQNLELKNSRIKPFTDVVLDANELDADDVPNLEAKIQQIQEDDQSAPPSQDITPEDLEGAEMKLLVEMRSDHPLSGRKGVVESVKQVKTGKAPKTVVKVLFAHPGLVFCKDQALQVDDKGRTEEPLDMVLTDAKTKKPLPAGTYTVAKARVDALEVVGAERPPQEDEEKDRKPTAVHKVPLTDNRVFVEGDATEITAIEGNPFSDFSRAEWDASVVSLIESILETQKKRLEEVKEANRKLRLKKAAARALKKAKDAKKNNAKENNESSDSKTAAKKKRSNSKAAAKKKRSNSQGAAKKKRPDSKGAAKKKRPDSAAKRTPAKKKRTAPYSRSADKKRSRSQSGGAAVSIGVSIPIGKPGKYVDDDDDRVWSALPSDPLRSRKKSSGEFERLLEAQTE